MRNAVRIGAFFVIFALGIFSTMKFNLSSQLHRLISIKTMPVERKVTVQRRVTQTNSKSIIDLRDLKQPDRTLAMRNGKTKSMEAKTTTLKAHQNGFADSATTRSTNQAHINEVLKNATDTDLLKLAFDRKLSLPAVEIRQITEYCNRTDAIGNSCNGKCQRLTLDKDVRKRIAQVVEPAHLQVSQKYNLVLEEMAKEVKGHYDVIIVTGASDNHYYESQSLLKNLHENVFPFLKNFTLVYYNLGLRAARRAKLVKHCKCQVIDFPFHKFPQFFQKLSCFSWKPVLVKAHISQSNVIAWMDSSIRIHGRGTFNHMVDTARKRGLLLATDLASDFTSRTMPTSFHFFGQEPCSYIKMGEIQGSFGLYAGEYLTERLVVEPWVACAIDQRCMCPVPFPTLDASKSIAMYKQWVSGKAPMKYGLAHRFDQSALAIIVFKLYRERYMDVMMTVDKFKYSIKRGDTSHYIDQLS